MSHLHLYHITMETTEGKRLGHNWLFITSHTPILAEGGSIAPSPSLKPLLKPLLTSLSQEGSVVAY